MILHTGKELRERDPDYCKFCPGGESKEQCDRCAKDHEGREEEDDDGGLS